MSHVNPLNPGQQQAVETRGKHILVSAPAGSGKTKILVSRILGLLKEGIEVDSLIVLTFTKDAASEMKQRLVTSLEEEIQKATSTQLKDHLIKQKSKIPFSYITNFHGFCKQLIEHYGFLVGVQMGFDVLADYEPVRQACLEEMLEQMFSTPKYDQFRRSYFPNTKDLKEYIEKLYENLQASGNKEQFISYFSDEVYGFFEQYDKKDLSEWKFYPSLLEILKTKAIEGQILLAELKAYCEDEGITPFYERPSDQKGRAALQPTPYESFQFYYDSILAKIEEKPVFYGEGGLHETCIQKPVKAYNIPWKASGIDDHDEFDKKKKKVNSHFADAYELLIDTRENSIQQISKLAKSALDILIEFVFEFEKAYQLKKEELNVLDFNDLEKYATLLLSNQFNIALDFNQKLKEIMVDEYQDTNHVQENIIQLISKASNKEVPCFMVGDMKQSIYRFRQADPEIFKQKYDLYPKMDNACRIDLGYNYRSSKVVLDSINFIFNQIMDSSIGELEYYHDKSAQLNYDFLRKGGATDDGQLEELTLKAKQQMAKAKDDFTEVLMVRTDTDNPLELDENEYEAYMIASRINDLVRDGLDGKPLNYNDICVLMRNTTDVITYKKVFDKLKIPANIVLSGGFKNAVEIRLMMMVLKAFNRPHDDLAMLTLLKAPFNFTNFQETMISGFMKEDMSIFDSIKDEPEFENFINEYQSLKQDLLNMPFSNWILKFYERSGYLDRVYYMKNGLSKYQNLQLFVERIKEKETEIFHIQDWVNYFESSGTDTPATLPKDNQAVVFTTIHKSKGLEYPVVFVAMHSKNFNLQDEKARIIFNRKLSMAIKPRRLESVDFSFNGYTTSFNDVVVEYDNPFLSLFRQITNRETISEEMRIYYVALTRAGKKLILTGCLSDEDMDKYIEIARKTDTMDLPENESGWIINRKDRKAGCYLDWLMPSVLRHHDILEKLQTYPEYQSIAAQMLAYFGNKPLESKLENTNNSRFTFRWYSHEEILENAKVSSENEKSRNHSLLFDASSYAYQDEIDKLKSIAVTSLEKQTHAVVKEPTSNISQIKQEYLLDAASIGTLVHEFMEHLPLHEPVNIKNRIETLKDQGFYTDVEYEVVLSYKDKLEKFVESDLFQLMKSSKQCLPEQPFCMLHEDMVIHGTIDVLCINDDSITIIDYKTDRVKNNASDEQLINKHEFQLNLYKEALSKIYPGKKVEAYLYYLEISKDIRV